MRIRTGLLRLVGHLYNLFISRFLLIKLTIQSLCYNHHMTSGYLVDTLLEPMFWFVDHFTHVLGPVCHLLR